MVEKVEDEDVPAVKEGPQVKLGPLSPKKSESDKWDTGLHRLFASELFDANMAIQYLFKSKEGGILQYLGNRLFNLPADELDFYLPQLLILYLYTEENTRKSIHPFLVKRCKENIDFALNCALLLGSVNDSLPQKRKQLAAKLRAAIIRGESAISRQNSSCSEIGIDTTLPEEKNEQLDFIEKLIDIGRRLVSQPDRESKTQRLVSELNEVNLLLPQRVWNPIACDLSHFVLRITPAAAVVLNSKDKAPYFAYLEVLLTPDKSVDSLPQKLLESSLHEGTFQSPPGLLERHAFSEDDELDETLKPAPIVNAATSSNDNSDISDHDEQAHSPSFPSISQKPLQSDVVSLSRISIRSGDSIQSYDTGQTVLAADIRLRLYQETTASMSDLRIDPDDPSAAALKEPFAEKERKIREASPYGHLKNWKLLPIIVKCGDDLRQEMLAYQLMTALKAAWDKEMTKIWIRPYKILVTGPDSGILEPIVNAPSVHQIKKMEPNGLQAYFISEFGEPNSEGYMKAMENFVLSCAGYSIVCYLLQVKDRHNGNILLDSEGHIVHIDFGFMLNSSPGKNLGFEQSAFKLTEDMVELMGGMESDNFRWYKVLLMKGLRAAAKHRDSIVTLAEVAQCGPRLSCFTSNTVKQFQERFLLQTPDEQLTLIIDSMVEGSVNSWTTKLYDQFQYLTNGIL